MKICATIVLIVMAIGQRCECDSTNNLKGETLEVAPQVLKTVVNKLSTGQTRDHVRAVDVSLCAKCIVSTSDAHTKVCGQACRNAVRRVVTTDVSQYNNKPYDDQKTRQCLCCLRNNANDCNRKCRLYDLDKLLALTLIGKEFKRECNNQDF